MLGKRIETLRKSGGLTQEELSRALGLSKSAVSMYESSKRKPEHGTLVRIANYFNVTTDYLLGSGAPTDSGYARAIGKARTNGITEQELLFAIDFLIQARGAGREEERADA